jgi:hypothetical protein
MSYAWLHSDARGWITGGAQATARAVARAWQDDAFAASTGTRVGDLRMLAMWTAILATGLSSAIPTPPGERTTTTTLDIDAASNFTTQERKDAARTLYATWLCLGGVTYDALPPMHERIRTDAGGAMTEEAGVLPALAVVVIAVVGIAAVAGVLCYVSQTAGNVVDRQLARNDDAKQLLGTHAETMGILNAHEAAETAAGHELPLTEIEKQKLAELRALAERFLAMRQAEGGMPQNMPKWPKMETTTWLALGALALVLLTTGKE